MNDGYTLNVSLDNGVSFSSALSESSRLFLRSLAVRSLASAVSEPPQFFVACEDCAARLALSLLWRLDNRVSSSSALSEARRISVSRILQFYARVVVEELRYVRRAGASQPSRDRTAGSDFITCAAHTNSTTTRAYNCNIRIHVHLTIYIYTVH